MSVELAKKVLSENCQVLFGIFGVIKVSGNFPPRQFLNEFLAQGNDPCDQDGRMERWPPFSLNQIEHEEVKNWWITQYPDSVVDDLTASNWSDWSVRIIESL